MEVDVVLNIENAKRIVSDLQKFLDKQTEKAP